MVKSVAAHLKSAADIPRSRLKAPCFDAGTWFDSSERLILVIFVLALAARFLARPWAPFWLDEAATGAIISQPTFGAFWQEVYWEVSSPLYFIFMRGWQAGFGLSDFALRAPSILFSIGAPLCILSSTVPGMRRADRLAWAVLLALWVPGIGYAQDARCYALVLLLSTLQTLAYIRLLNAPSLRNCAAWVSFAALTTAAHYDAAFLAVFQGLFFVGLKPREALKCLPTGLIMLPTIALILWQGPEMMRFMKSDTTWYRLYGPFEALRAVVYMLGGWAWVVALPLLLIAAVIGGRRHPREDVRAEKAVVWAAVSSLIGAGALIAIAMYRPILSLRYLVPFVPGILLLLIVVAHVVARGAAQSIISWLVGCGTAILLIWLAMGAPHTDSVAEALNYEISSNKIMQAGARHVVFTWDNPNARAMHPDQIREFGTFFFKRADYPVDVIPVQIKKDHDPNKLLLDAARPTDAAIIWAYDTSVQGTAAKSFPPKISELDTGWKCEHAVDGTFGIVTCFPVVRQGSHP